MKKIHIRHLPYFMQHGSAPIGLTSLLSILHFLGLIGFAHSGKQRRHAPMALI
ncbi:hypothetical protein [Paenibacillus sp. JCM 10914]